MSADMRESSAQFAEASQEWVRDWDAGQTAWPPVLYHYTDAAGFLGICDTQQLWGSDARFLNDASELDYMYEVFQDVADDLRNDYDEDSAPRKMLDLIVNTIWGTALRDQFDVYVCCFCAKGDLLSQWRGYRATGGGYAIGFTPAALQASGGMLRRVIYETEDQRQWLRRAIKPLCDAVLRMSHTDFLQFVDEITTAGHLAVLGTHLVECAFLFKHEAFSEEAEWRLVQLRFGKVGQTPRVRPKGNSLLPYIVTTLKSGPDGQQPIAEVIVGPTVHPVLATNAAVQVLANADYASAAEMVKLSAVPLRV